MILTSTDKIQTYTSKGWWTESTILDQLQNLIETEATKEAVIDPGNKAALCSTPMYRLTFAELNAKINYVASILQQHGIGKDDIVAIQLPNIAELVISYFAICKLGAISSPIPIQFREFECTQLINSLNAKAVITMKQINERSYAAMYDEIRSTEQNVETIFTFDHAENAIHINLDNAVDTPVEQPTITANDIFTICWTSGTEGKPKGVPRSHNEWYVSAYASVDAAKLTQNDRILLTFPLVNMAGIGGVLVPWVLSGGTLVLHHPFDFPTFLAQIDQEQITYTLVPPSLLTMMLKNDAILAGRNIQALRAIGTGSAPITPWLIDSWKEIHGVDLINYFGSNEGATFLSDADDVPNPLHRSLYLPRFGPSHLKWQNRVGQMVESKLVDLDTGEEITVANRPGELRIKGPGVFSGYWNAQDLNEKSFDEQGYFKTGDLFEIIEEDGEDRYYRVVGRIKDIIVRSGMKISPLEIEEILQSHPSIQDVAIVPIPHQKHGEISCACVALASDKTITLNEIVSFLNEYKVASFKLPEKLIIVEQLPRNAVGKILKAALIDSILQQDVSV